MGLKHGRVAMMASVGLVGQHFVKFPGFEQTPAGLGALYTAEDILGSIGLFCVSAILELAWRDDRGREPGNYGDPFGVRMYDDEMRNKEINNGRFAMICVLGIFAAGWPQARMRSSSSASDPCSLVLGASTMYRLRVLRRASRLEYIATFACQEKAQSSCLFWPRPLRPSATTFRTGASRRFSHGADQVVCRCR